MNEKPAAAVRALCEMALDIAADTGDWAGASAWASDRRRFWADRWSAEPYRRDLAEALDCFAMLRDVTAMIAAL